MPKILQRSVTMQGGREGKLKEESGAFELDLKTPVEMGGDGQNAPNPEALFAAAYGSCFAASLEYMLTEAKVTYADLNVRTTAILRSDSSDGFKFDLEVEVAIKGLNEKQIATYIKKAKAFCPVSKAIEGNVDITFK